MKFFLVFLFVYDKYFYAISKNRTFTDFTSANTPHDLSIRIFHSMFTGMNDFLIPNVREFVLYQIYANHR